MRTCVAVDILGGDRAPEGVLAGVAVALTVDPSLHVALVGPPSAVADAAFVDDRVTVVPADDVIAVGDDPVAAVRARRNSGIRVATATVRAGRADAVVSAGPEAATIAAATFTLGLLPGATRPALAVTLPTERGPVLLIDANGHCGAATPGDGADALVQLAYAGAAFASVSLGLADPRIGLLAADRALAGADALRRGAHDALVASPLNFLGLVTARAVTAGGHVDVVVTDGFTGAVLRSALAGKADAGVVLGVDGVVVTAPDASAHVVAASIATAAAVARADAAGAVRSAFGELVTRRRELAGLR